MTTANTTKSPTVKHYKSPVDRLKAGGLDVIRSPEGFKGALSAFSFAPVDHLLAHPRQHLPLDPEMVTDIAENGVQKDILVYEVVTEEIVSETGEYRRQLFILNGARRVNHAMAAEKMNRFNGFLAEDEFMRLKFRLFEGTMVEALMEQLRDNADPLKVADSVGTLAVMISKLLRLGISKEKIVSKCPKGIGAVEVEALTQWSKLTPEVAARFESGEAPIGLLAAVVAVPESKQMETLDKLLSSGAKTSKGATRALRKESAQKSGGTGERLHPKRVAKVIEAMGKPTKGSFADAFLKGILFVEGKLDLADLPADVRAQVMSFLPATVTVTAK